MLLNQFEVNFQTLYSKQARINRKSYKYLLGIDLDSLFARDLVEQVYSIFKESVTINGFYFDSLEILSDINKYNLAIDSTHKIATASKQGYLKFEPKFKRLNYESNGKLNKFLNSNLQSKIVLNTNIILINVSIDFNILKNDKGEYYDEFENSRRLPKWLETKLSLSKDSYVEFVLPYGILRYELNSNEEITNALHKNKFRALKELKSRSNSLDSSLIRKIIINEKLLNKINLIKYNEDSLLIRSLNSVENLFDSCLIKFESKY